MKISMPAMVHLVCGLLESRAHGKKSLQYEGSRWDEVIAAAEVVLIDFWHAEARFCSQVLF